ncbi:MAG: hypothetical protein R6W72_03325 [Desulfurivibrionaceae bacterium]
MINSKLNFILRVKKKLQGQRGVDGNKNPHLLEGKRTGGPARGLGKDR